jgi:hypothetical protein
MKKGAQKDDLPMGSIRESVEMGRLIELEHMETTNAARKERNSILLRIHRAKSNHAPAETLEALNAQLRAVLLPRSRDIAAAAVGLKVWEYEEARTVIAAADAEPERFGDLLAVLETSINAAHAELRRRRGQAQGKRPALALLKNTLLRKGLRPQHNDMMDRAVRALEGAVMGLKLVEHDELDRTRLGPWLAAFTETSAYLRSLHKELIKLYGEE